MLKPKLRKKPSKRKIRRRELTCLLTGKKRNVNYAKIKLLLARLRFENYEKLANNYICSEACTLLRQGYSEIQIRSKYKCSNTTIVTFDLIKRYIKSFDYKEKMLRRRKRRATTDLITDIQRSGTIVAKYAPEKLKLSDANTLRQLTTGVCIRPDIHLNHDYSCNFCPHFQHCACSVKHWNKKLLKQNVKSNKKTK